MNFHMTKVAVGATADLFDIGDGKLFKRFHDDKPDGSIDNEYSCTKLVQDFNLGAPKVYERINDENGRGFVMEYIHGENMLDKMLSTPSEGEALIREWVRLHHKVNSIHTTAFDSPHDIYPWRIHSSNHLNDEEKNKLTALLKTLPVEHDLCHTDLHPGNIMLTKDGSRIIDWCDALSASKWCDVARTLLIFELVDVPKNLEEKAVTGFINSGKEAFLREYQKLNGTAPYELEAWMAILAAIRLDSETEKNREPLYRIIHDFL